MNDAPVSEPHIRKGWLGETKSIYRDCAFFSGGGGLVSTAHDYFRFASMMLNKGELDGIRLLDETRSSS